MRCWREEATPPNGDEGSSLAGHTHTHAQACLLRSKMGERIVLHMQRLQQRESERENAPARRERRTPAKIRSRAGGPTRPTTLPTAPPSPPPTYQHRVQRHKKRKTSSPLPTFSGSAFLTLNDGTSFSGRTKLNRNEAGSPLSTLSFLSKTATSEAKTHADLSSASPPYLSVSNTGVGNDRTRKKTWQSSV